MNTLCVYHLQLRGQVDEDDANAMGPLPLVREWGNKAVTQFAITTDQSGLIGMLRHLHGLGFELLSVTLEA